jgi:outer membrane protein assembly factor BamB
MTSLDAATGRLRWSYTTGDSVVSTPAVAGGVVYSALATRCTSCTLPDSSTGGNNGYG